jgi:cysteine desulfurase
MTIYLDYQAATPIDPRVMAVMIEALKEDFANPSSESHIAGWRAKARVECARQDIAYAIKCEANELIFTSGATEADNIAVLGAALAAPAERRRILVGSTEHKAVIAPALAAERFGFTVEFLPVDRNGIVNIAELKKLLGQDVAVVSIMIVNNEIGTIQSFEDIAPLVTQSGAFFHTDATQAPIAMSLNMHDLGVDAASFSSHKIYGPKGIGALYLSATAPWRPQAVMFGGGQEGGLRPGTIPTHLCAGFATAFAIMAEESENEREWLRLIRDDFARLLIESIAGCRLTTNMSNHHPGNLHLSFEGINAGDLLDRIQPRLAAARGSACTSGEEDYSHVLKSIGMGPHEASQCIRLSLGRFTTSEELRDALSILETAISQIRAS